MKYLPLIVIFTFILSSCSDKKAKSNTTSEPLSNTAWKLISIHGDEQQDQQISLQFDEDKLNGKGVCNRYFATYRQSGNKLSIEGIGSTKMACAENGALEVKYFSMLEKVSEFKIEGNHLILKTSTGDLAFEKNSNPTSKLKLMENHLGPLKLAPSSSTTENELRGRFPGFEITRETAQQDGPNYTSVTLKRDRDVFQIELGKGLNQRTDEISNVLVKSPGIPDQYGIKQGMTFQAVQSQRPGLQITTDPHFHTYAFSKDSYIRYEICCNELGPDKTNWSADEISNWKVKTIIWTGTSL